jgi:DNA-directed RNA polymerase specialized sigma24 family protein
MERTARSDEQLVGLCQSGDFTAFEELYERYQRPILAYIYQITRNYEEAACIAQDVFLKVFEHVDRFDVTRRFSTCASRPGSTPSPATRRSTTCSRAAAR